MFERFGRTFVWGKAASMISVATCAEPDWRLDVVAICQTVVGFCF